MSVEEWLLDTLRSSSAPECVLESADALVSLRGLLGAARSAQAHDVIPAGATSWLADTLAERLSGLPDEGASGLDACLALVTGSRALLEATGEEFSSALEATDHLLALGLASDRVENYERTPSLARLYRDCHPRMAAVSAFLEAVSSETTGTRLRGLAFGAILCSRQGMAGVPAVPFADLLEGRKPRLAQANLCLEHALLLPGEHCAATWVHHYLAGALGWAGAVGGGDTAHPDFEDVFGDANVPLGWAVYAMAMRYGSNTNCSLDGSAFSPQVREPIHLVIRDARRFARRAALAHPALTPFLRQAGLQEADPLGTGWLAEEIAANLEGLWEERAASSFPLKVVSAVGVEKIGWMGEDTTSLGGITGVPLFEGTSALLIQES